MFALKPIRASTHHGPRPNCEPRDRSPWSQSRASQVGTPSPIHPGLLFHPKLLQTRLKVGSIDDPLELEAEQMAAQVMQGRTISPRSYGGPQVQRKCDVCEHEEHEGGSASEVLLSRKCAHCREEEEQLTGVSTQMQRKCAKCEEEEQSLHRKPPSARSISEVPPLVHEVLRSPGESLTPDDRAFFEPRFGFDLSHVRIHADAAAAESARSVAAQAYTVGRDITFAEGLYQPGADAGRQLLAHELAHVVQQSGGTARLRRAAAAQDSDDARQNSVGATVEIPIAAAASARATEESLSGVLRRQPQDVKDADTKDTDGTDVGAEHVLTRPEEIRLSRTSPGGVAVTRNPIGISLYNFAIDAADLKKEHRELIAELAAVIKLARGTGSVQIFASGNADVTGTPNINKPLSRHRAVAVQAELSRLSGANIQVTWHGEDDPVADNNSVDGRSHNRRVDILFVPTTIEEREDDDGDGDDDDHDHDGDDDDEDDDGNDDGHHPPKSFCDRFPWICACPNHPYLCGSIIVILFCVMNPEFCFDWKWPCIWPFCRKKKKKDEEEEKPPKKRACPISVSLPSGPQPTRIYRGIFGGDVIASREWQMEIEFMEDPQTGCACNCGEYRQYVRGFVERDSGTGIMVDDPGITLVGGVLDRNIWLEDARDGNPRLPYGHRYWDTTRTFPRSNTDTVSNNDKFSSPDDREQGCAYEGSDQPQAGSKKPGETVHLHMEFRGAPVDACNAPGVPLWGWEEWLVDGTVTVPRQPPPIPKPRPGPSKPPQGPSAPTGPVTHITPRPATTRPVRPVALRYAGGLPHDAHKYQTFTLHLQFDSNGKTYDGPIPVEVTDEDADTVTIEVIGPSMDISPSGSHETIVTTPGHPAKVPRRILDP